MKIKNLINYLAFFIAVVTFISAITQGDFRDLLGYEITGGKRYICYMICIVLVVGTGYLAYKQACWDLKALIKQRRRERESSHKKPNPPINP